MIKYNINAFLNNNKYNIFMNHYYLDEVIV